MKAKMIIILSLFFSLFLGLLLMFALFFGETDNTANGSEFPSDSLSVSVEVLKHKSMVEKFCKKYGISDYVNVILAIMQIESGGTPPDVMQASESLGLPPNSLSTEESIKQGCNYFSTLISSIEAKGCDVSSAIQAYNYGGGFLDYVEKNGKKYSYELAEAFSKEKSGDVKVAYTNPIATTKNSGWRYNYGNQFYYLLVSQYLKPTVFDNETVKNVMKEALKYENYPYVFGGASPVTSFDCSGLTQWCYAKAGIHLPRTAQAQYDTTTHIELKDAQAGDLVFFKNTYDAGTLITHVGIFVGNMQMYNAGDPIGYADLTSSYWQQHLVSAGRVTK